MSPAGIIDVLLTGFAGTINSEVAMLCELDGEGHPIQISSWGAGMASPLITRPREGGFVGRAPLSPARRAASSRST